MLILKRRNSMKMCTKLYKTKLLLYYVLHERHELGFLKKYVRQGILPFDIFYITIQIEGKTNFSQIVFNFISFSRSSHRRCSVRKGVLRNFANFTGNFL